MLCAHIQNFASCVGEEHIFIKKVKKYGRKMKIGSEKRSMVSLMPICAGSVRPEVGNVDFIMVFVYFLKGQEGPVDANRTNS